MATIGTFTRSENGFVGTLRTLNVSAKARLVAEATRDNERAPDYRVLGPGNAEIGAAWKKTARETGREYLAVKLDDPSFPAPIYASLVEAEGGDGTYALIWSRRNGD